MANLSKKFKFLCSREFYNGVLLFIVFTLVIYPPNVGNAKTQSIRANKYVPAKVVSKVDSLKIELKRIDSLINKQGVILQKQQDTLKILTKKQ